MRSNNSYKGPHDALERLQYTISGKLMPIDTVVPQPANWGLLSVAGNECVPGTAARPAWNKQKSAAVLRAYLEDDDASESEDEATESTRSRCRRLKLADAYGVSTTKIGAFVATYS